MKKTCYLFLASIFSIFLLYMGCLVPANNSVFLNKDKTAKVKSIAVLPFYNLSEVLNAETIIANIIMSELVSTQIFNVVKYGDVKELLLKQKISSVSMTDIDTLHLIRKRLKADAIIMGTIYRYEEPQEKEGDRFSSLIDINVCLLDTKSGQIIWQEGLIETGSSKGYLFDRMEVYPCFGLARKAISKLISKLIIHGGYS